MPFGMLAATITRIEEHRLWLLLAQPAGALTGLTVGHTRSHRLLAAFPYATLVM
jgi:hypothetical protein